MVILAGRTGLRFGECAGLLWSNPELDAETVEALKPHRKGDGDDPAGRVVTTLGGSRGPGGTVNARNFGRVWRRALQETGLGVESGFTTVTTTLSSSMSGAG